MELETFFEINKGRHVVLHKGRKDEPASLLGNDTLFQLPFIAISILMLSKVKAKPRTENIGAILGECFDLSVKGFKSNPAQITWSSNLRVRTATALVFLEAATLIEVDAESKKITATDLGRRVIEKALAQESYLSLALKKVERAYRNIRSEKQIRMAI